MLSIQYRSERSSLTNISYTHRIRTIEVNKKNLSYLKAPGPGEYESIDMTPANGKFRISNYSNGRLAKICQDRRFKESKGMSPSPLSYSSIDNINKESKYVLSKRKGQGSTPFDRERKFTFKYWKSDSNPAPSSYDKPSDFGVYGDTNYYKTLGFKY